MKSQEESLHSQHRVCVINCSDTCENSGFMWQRVLGFLRANNYDVGPALDGCQTILVNTCCVTQGRIKQAQETIAAARRAGPHARVIIFGCLAGLSDARALGNDVVLIGPHSLADLQQHFPYQVPLAESVSGTLDAEALCPYQQKVNNQDAFVLIAQGCVNNCSYCNIKRAKGNVSSVQRTAICAAIEQGLAHGRQEFVLLADDCGSYGADVGTNLLDVLDAIAKIDRRVRVKLHSLFPGEFLAMAAGLIELAAGGLISYANIPVQSGSQRVLAMMNRNYDIAAVAARLAQLRARAPATWLHTHFIVGFPGETDADFAASLRLVPQFDEVLFLAYSDNPGTRAARLDSKVDAAVVRARLAEVKRRFPSSCVTVISDT